MLFVVVEFLFVFCLLFACLFLLFGSCFVLFFVVVVFSFKGVKGKKIK